ncbi:hypothetical protein ACFE04_019062 [Oxalis oulophora]
MDIHDQCDEENNMALIRKGPWTVGEDSALFNYISVHGEGRWNLVAHCAGLKRTGKSCRLRWLNYLRPNVRRGNITLQEQLLILELHSRWGNRWSKIAEHLPGRTDNEIKNYWRTRVQKQAKQLKCDVNSQQFRDTMRHVWMPRLVERIQADSGSSIRVDPNCMPEASSDSNTTYVSPEQPADHNPIIYNTQSGSGMKMEETGCISSNNWGGYDFQSYEKEWLRGGESLDGMMWNDENVWFLQQQLGVGVSLRDASLDY